ncbi:MAG: sortase [Microgenomates group bacterium]
MKEIVIYEASKPEKTFRRKIKVILRSVSFFLLLISFLGFIFSFGPILKAEIKYLLKKQIKTSYFASLLKESQAYEPPLIAPDPYFSLIIPKIEAKAKILPNIDASNPEIYLEALKEGVAHAQGTFFPGMKGTIFLFAHSTDSPLNIRRYNAVFYLLKELEPQDEIVVVFLNRRFNYQVVEKKIVNRKDTQFFFQAEKEQLVLQTCWPPGTTQKALLIFAERKN